ncbi:uncharacterized protein PG986_002670 [Apiospora aurea]|uniref:Uncharacterized protein n=1 Tax=Apiospora aurea TaxID=335848 RepID=A0ABR1QPH7_9PEZI
MPRHSRDANREDVVIVGRSSVATPKRVSAPRRALPSTAELSPSPTQHFRLLSFGDSVIKYEVQDHVPQVFRYDQGALPLLGITMLYLFKYLNWGEANGFKQGFPRVDQHSATELQGCHWVFATSR